MYSSIDYKPVTYSGSLGIIKQTPPDILFVQAQSREVIRITPSGEIYWNQRLVETDQDFKACMLDMAEHFKRRWL
jgi:hypothetical protein